MKVIFILMTVALVQVSANTSAQQLTIVHPNITLKEFFREVHQQTGLVVLYHSATIERIPPFEVRLENQPLVSALHAVLDGKQLEYTIREKEIVIKEAPPRHAGSDASPRAAENASPLILAFPIVKGRVVDSLGNPLQGASVRVLDAEGRRTTLQTKTDDDGYFELRNVPEGYQLEFSYIGHVTITIMAAAEVGTVELQAVPSELEEVEVMVNTGYQSLKANEINGEIVHIDNRTLNLQAGTNILDRLNGVTNGLTFNIGKNNYNNPQNKTNIVIRGHSTLNGPLDPLIVLDNFVYEGDIANINPNDVASVAILKDASATSIYGARGGNGVIVITTKKGQFNQPLSIHGNVSAIVTAAPNLFDVPQLPSADYIGIEEMMFKNGYFNGILNSLTTPLTPAVKVFADRSAGKISAADSAAMIDWLKTVDTRRQYQDAFYGKALTKQYAVNVSGGSAKYNWLLSASRDENTDHYSSTSGKNNANLHHTFKPIKPLTIQTNVYYTGRRGTQDVVEPFGSLTRVGTRQSVPYVPLFDPSGGVLPIYRGYSQHYLDTVGQGDLLDWHFYPTIDRTQDRRVSEISELSASIQTRYDIIPGLSAQVMYHVQQQKSDISNEHDSDSYYTRDLINRFAQIGENDRTVKYIVPLGGIISRSQAAVKSYNFRSQLDFNRRFAQHNVQAMMGFEMREVSTEGFSSTTYGYINDPLSYQPVDHVNSYPTRPSSSSSILGAPIIEPSVINRFISIYGNFSYLFLDKYSVSASARKDGSNLYGVSTNEKWKPLWSVGLGYDLSKESFFSSKTINSLRFKASLGYSGNVDLRKSAVPVIGFATNAPQDGGFPRGNIGTIPNPSLKWEQVRQVNLGADFALFRNRLRGSISYYFKDGTDLYGPRRYDYLVWGAQSTLVTNVANMSGKGIDIALDGRVVDQNDGLKWDMALIYNFNRSITKDYFYADDKDNLARVLSSSGSMITPVVGKPLYALAAFRWGGLDAEGNPQGYLNGELSNDYAAIINAGYGHAEKSGGVVYIGSAVPEHFGAFRQELQFKGVSLQLNMTYKFGYFFRNSTIMYSSLINNGYAHPDYLKRWKKPGDEHTTNVPSFIYPQTVYGRDDIYSNSEIHIEKGDHIRLQFVQIGYHLDQRIIPYFSSVNFYLNVSNLGVVWKAAKKVKDPDYPDQVLPGKTFSFGLRFGI